MKSAGSCCRLGSARAARVGFGAPAEVGRRQGASSGPRTIHHPHPRLILTSSAHYGFQVRAVVASDWIDPVGHMSTHGARNSSATESKGATSEISLPPARRTPLAAASKRPCLAAEKSAPSVRNMRPLYTIDQNLFRSLNVKVATNSV